jgi:hypothetical protein
MATPSNPPHSTADRAATVVTAILAVLTAGASVMLSPFFVMATDACGSDNCDLSRLNWAYVVTWGGVALAVVVAVAGVVRAARRGTVMWIWPVVAIALVVVTFGLGFLLATSVLQQG